MAPRLPESAYVAESGETAVAARGRSPARRSSLGSGKVPSVSRTALLDQGSDYRFRQLVQDILAVCARVQAIREEFGRTAGLTGPQYSLIVAIAHLAESEAGTTVNQLANHLHVSGTYVTAEANKLEAAGLLLRAPNPKDKRSVLLKLTRSGLELLDQMIPVIRRINDEIFRDLARADFELLVRLMAGLAESAADALALARVYPRKR
jgi:DNA-binding MarR family transcriptional regulator